MTSLLINKLNYITYKIMVNNDFSSDIVGSRSKFKIYLYLYIIFLHIIVIFFKISNKIRFFKKIF